MPVAISMNIPGSGPSTPTAQRISKAAFFRSRSPPILDRASPHDLSARIDAQTRNRDLDSSNEALSPELSGEGMSAPSQNGTTGHTPLLEASTSYQLRGAGSPASSQAQHQTNGGPDGNYADDDTGEGSMAESTGMSMAGGSDEMLMTLLASQAVVDCEELSIGGWEEVESWKKVYNSSFTTMLGLTSTRSSPFYQTDCHHWSLDTSGRSRSLQRQGRYKS